MHVVSIQYESRFSDLAVVEMKAFVKSYFRSTTLAAEIMASVT